MSRHGGWWVVDLPDEGMRPATRKDFADDGWTQTDPGELAAECRRLADEISLMREEVESQELAHAEEVARYQAIIRNADRAYQVGVVRWKAAALQYAARLARLGHKVKLPDAPDVAPQASARPRCRGCWDPEYTHDSECPHFVPMDVPAKQ